jgi:hypothetical protein
MPDAEVDWDAIEINGEKKSLTEWCRQTGVDRRIARQRMHDLRWPPAQAVGLEDRVRQTWATDSRFQGKRDVTLTYRGRERTLKEWHEITGVPYRTIVDRYNKGKSPEEILHKGRLPIPTWSSDDIETAAVEYAEK